MAGKVFEATKSFTEAALPDFEVTNNSLKTPERISRADKTLRTLHRASESDWKAAREKAEKELVLTGHSVSAMRSLRASAKGLS